MQSGGLADFDSKTDVRRQAISRLIEDNRGVTAIEYALIAH